MTKATNQSKRNNGVCLSDVANTHVSTWSFYSEAFRIVKLRFSLVTDHFLADRTFLYAPFLISPSGLCGYMWEPPVALSYTNSTDCIHLTLKVLPNDVINL